MSLSQSPTSDPAELDWRTVFDRAYSHSLYLDSGEPVPHGKLSASLRDVAGVGGNAAATRLIHEAVAAGTLTASPGEFSDNYELVSGEGGTLPTGVRDREQWVCWRYQDRPGGKPAKLPVDPHTGHRASPTDPDTWASYDEAAAYPDADGLGFVFTDDDPYVGVDLDGCVAEDGTIETWAQAIVEQMNSYTEYSPSGTGLHIIARGAVPGERNRRDSVEMYEQDRYFTVTGDHLPETPTTVEPRQDALDAVYADHLAADSGEGGDDTETENMEREEDDPSTAPLTLSDEDLLEKARSAKNGETFTRLWDGDTSGYESHSEADSALCCELAFWTGGDREQIDRLFRQSGLMRPKWDEARGKQTYGERTIETALSVVTNYYDPTEMANSYDSNYRQYPNAGQQPDQPADPHADTLTIEDVREVVIGEFDEQTWHATEAVLAAHATLLLDGSNGTGLVLVGPSSSGKTTVLEFFEGLDTVYRSDDVTPASFVSHDASKGDDELAEIDLIPKVKQKSLLSRDMATWFAGDQEDIHKRMSVMTHLLDGGGYTRDTGTHGSRGYEGRDYRFNFIGATTPLSPRAWRVMGNVGTRLVFYERTGETDVTSVVDDLLDGSNYHEKVTRCQAVVEDFIRQVWADTGGFASVEDVRPSEESARDILGYLIELVRYSRAVTDDGSVRREGAPRIGATLRDIAQARALLDGRREFTSEDMAVCARIALSTMPADRRAVIQALLDPRNHGELTAADVERVAGVSRPTAHKRMELLDALDIGVFNERDDDERETKTLRVRQKFEWPEAIEFPAF